MDLRYHTALDGPSLRALGIPEPWIFGLADRVRFGELDAVGHVNHTAYLRWFESFRLPYLKARKVTDYGPTSPRLVLRSVAAHYMAEMGADVDYVVTGRTRAFRTTSFTMEFGVFLPTDAGDAQMTASGEAVVVLLRRDGRGRYPLPDAGRQAFVALDRARADRV